MLYWSTSVSWRLQRQWVRRGVEEGFGEGGAWVDSYWRQGHMATIPAGDILGF